MTLRVPRNTPSGRYRVMVCADVKHTVQETRENNNCRLSTTVARVRRRRGAVAMSLSSAPLQPARYIIAAPGPPGAPRRTTPILLILLGVTLIVAGTTLVGLRRRPALT